MTEAIGQAEALLRAGDLDGAARTCRGLEKDPGAARILGIVAARRGRASEAEQLLRRAVAGRPGFAEAWADLGGLLHALGRSGAAVEAYRAAIRAAPRWADPCRDLGVVLMTARRWAEAAQALARAFALAPEAAQTCAHLAHARQMAGDRSGAITAWRRVTALVPRHPAGFRELGVLLAEAGETEEAAAALFTALAYDPGDATTRSRLLEVWPGARNGPPPLYVKRLFDHYAPRFETHLVDELGYRAPEELVALLRPHAADAIGHAVDLGCGTGLVGQRLREAFDIRRLEGVDLSPAMIEASRGKGVYDALHAQDIVAFLEASDPPLDLIVAADTFIYVGDPAPTFRAAAKRLRPGGWLLFSVEPIQGEGFELLPTGRYGHAPALIERLATENGFEVTARNDGPLRREGDTFLPGLYMLLERQP